MRIVLLLVGLAATGGLVHAQDPGARQDTEDAREKILKTADQIDLLETNSEATRTSVEAMKGDLAKLQDDNAQLRQRLDALQARLDQAEADRAKERQALLDEVAKLVAAGKSPPAKHHAEETPPAPAATSGTAATAPPPDTGTAAPAPKKQKGYYHVVESGETLGMICAAYRDQGVHVTLAQVRKANHLTADSVLKPGQKLFIPKPEAAE